MIEHGKNLLVTAYNQLRDGTSRVAYRLYNASEDKLKYLYIRDKIGFYNLIDVDLDTVKIDTYRPIVADEGRWATFTTDKLDTYFRYKPCCNATGASSLLATCNDKRHEAQQFASRDTPEAFIRTSMAHLELQFPGGLAGDIGDQDYRNLIASRGLIFYNNFRRLDDIHQEATETARRWLLTAAALVCLFELLTLVHFHLGAPLASLLPAVVAGIAKPPLLTALTVILVSIILGGRFLVLHHKTELIDAHFHTTTSAANATIAKCAHQRQESLISTAGDVLAELEKGNEKHWAKQQTLRWPIEGQNWSEVLDWLDGRIGANHLYACQNASLLRLAYPSLHTRAEVTARRQFTGHFLLLLFLFLGTAWISGARLASGHFGWVDILCLSLWVVIAAGFAWTQQLQTTDISPESLDKIFHEESFARLKGKADANIPARRARLVRSQREKTLYADVVRGRLKIEEDKNDET